mmetsp:Transcript_17657/g.49379  ORF Transcript_17657/g.49379 Transcript_17657/m.49379 type:complete len:145 (+) Transcript_17657:121-555(+)
MAAVCAAVIGPLNNPLYLQTFLDGSDEEQLKFHYIVHCSLDAIEEKVAAPKRANEINDTYLGLLYPTEDYQVYGYISNTRIKLVLVADKADLKEAELKKAFQQMYQAYMNAASNPFYTPGQPITSAKFDTAIRKVVQSFTSPGG